MRQIYKDIIIGFILASFVFAPGAFAKPKAPKLIQRTSKVPLYSKMAKTIKNSRRGVKISDFVGSAEPMVKNREFRDIKKMLMPFWDKKFDSLNVGDDYFKLTFKGQTIFARYVDRGPVAFIINNKPLLWKDVLIYSRIKARVTEIITGKKPKKAKKVSMIEMLLQDMFPSAHAKTEAQCDEIIGAKYTSAKKCICTVGVLKGKKATDEGCPVDDKEPRDPPPTVVDPKDPPGPIVYEPEPYPEEEEEKSGINWWMIGIVGAIILLIIFLLKKKKHKKKIVPDVDPPPVPGWTPEPEGQCPTPGARGLTDADLPPECRKSNCQTRTNGTCLRSNGGVIH